MEYKPNRRILVIDDNLAIHEDFRKTLIDPAGASTEFVDAEAALFDDAPTAAPANAPAQEYELDFAAQGREGFDMVRAAFDRGEPYALTFVDVRMPPGWDGVDTIAKLWTIDASLQAVICTAFADYSWQDMIAKLGRTDRLLILKKPFDPIEVRQLASALTEKWNTSRREKMALDSALASELEARAYASSLETVNRALETSRQAAEAQSQTKSRLLLRMARNLYSPMDAIFEAADKVRHANESDESAWLSNLGELCRDGGGLRRSLQDVLDLSEMEAGSLSLERASFSPREAAKQVIEQCREGAAARSLALELECASNVPALVSSDLARVKQILGHLLDNAIEHTPAHGFVRMIVKTSKASGWPEPMLCFEVIDSGAGLTRDQEGMLFEPFCHTGDGDSSLPGHFGLGLSVSKRLAQRLGGDLTVEAAGNTGCRFVLTLKASVESPGVAPQQ